MQIQDTLDNYMLKVKELGQYLENPNRLFYTSWKTVLKIPVWKITGRNFEHKSVDTSSYVPSD